MIVSPQPLCLVFYYFDCFFSNGAEQDEGVECRLESLYSHLLRPTACSGGLSAKTLIFTIVIMEWWVRCSLV